MPRLHAPQMAHRKPRRATAAALDNLATTMARIADRAVVADIESTAARIGASHDRCYDVRPMLDARERGPESVDMASEALAYAITRGLVVPSEGTPWLVRIVT